MCPMVTGRPKFHDDLADSDCLFCPLIAKVREDERAAALREAVEAVKAVYTPQEGTYVGLCIHADAVAAIEALSTNADNSTNVHERRHAAAELTRMAQEDGLS